MVLVVNYGISNTTTMFCRDFREMGQMTYHIGKYGDIGNCEPLYSAVPLKTWSIFSQIFTKDTQ